MPRSCWTSSWAKVTSLPSRKGRRRLQWGLQQRRVQGAVAGLNRAVDHQEAGALLSLLLLLLPSPAVYVPSGL